MDFHVKTLSGETIVVAAEPESTVKDFKSQLAVQLEVPATFRLYHGKRFLGNALTMNSLAGAVLRMTAQQTPEEQAQGRLNKVGKVSYAHKGLRADMKAIQSEVIAGSTKVLSIQRLPLTLLETSW